jgi:MFS family permease
LTRFAPIVSRNGSLPFFYGWVMLPVAMALQVGTSPGQTYGVSVFNPFIREALGLSHSELTGSYLVASLLAAAPLPIVGWLIDRFGLRATALGVISLLGIACLAISGADGLIGLTLGFLLLRTFGQGSLTLIANNTLAMWFSRRLGTVSGLSGLGFSGAIAIVPATFLLLIHGMGWRWTFRVVGFGTWFLLIPLVFLLYRNHPADVGQQLDGDPSPSEGETNLGREAESTAPSSLAQSFDLWQACRTRSYWIALAISALWGMIATAVFFNIIPIFAWQGLSETQAAATFTTFAIAMAISQVASGILADRVPLNVLLSLSAVGLLGGILTLWNMNSAIVAHLYAMQFGAAQGLLIAVGNTLWPRYFGRVHLGQIRSSIWTATVASCSVGPFLMGLSIDMLGGYGPSLALFAALLSVASLLGFFATAPSFPAISERVLKCTD